MPDPSPSGRWTVARDLLGGRKGDWRVVPSGPLGALFANESREAVEVMPVSDHEAALAEERKMANALSSDLTKLARDHEEEVARLRSVLEPFSKLADEADEFGHGPGSSCEWLIAYDALVAARAALSGQGEG